MAIADRLPSREKLVQKTINIDDRLYTRLEGVADKLEISISKIINACILELAEQENVRLYDGSNELLVKHTILFQERALREVERLKEKYRISFYKMVNIAIHNVIDELEELP